MMTKSFSAMMKYGRSSDARVTEVLRSGGDPEVRIGPSAKDWNGRTASQNRTPLYIELACEVIEAFEKGVSGSDLLLNSTIEHEIVHWLDISAPGPMHPDREVGKAYEVEIYGRDIGPDVLGR